MKITQSLLYFVSLLSLATVICGCPPLDYKIYIRNTTMDSAHISLLYSNPFDTISRKEIIFRAKKEIVPINNKTLSHLNENLVAHANREKIQIVVPPKTTFFLSDIANSYSLVTHMRLIVRQANRSDTIIAHSTSSRKRFKNLEKKRDKSYNYFYRTIIFYDIK